MEESKFLYEGPQNKEEKPTFYLIVRRLVLTKKIWFIFFFLKLIIFFLLFILFRIKLEYAKDINRLIIYTMKVLGTKVNR